MTTPTVPPDPITEATFAELGLAAPVLAALEAVGYETPTPIQARTIPPLLAGRDLLGQAQTGTGKTAAFALPLLSRIDVERHAPQVLVLAPTRELAIQVAEAFQRYAANLPNLHVLPIYGGQDYSVQLRMLKRGVHVVVGTPGRVMDHMRRGSLVLDGLQALVLDEADEMLRMGFIDDVEWILQQTPPERQLALFSATMPSEVQRIARSHLQDPEEIRLESRSATAASVRQRVWMVAGTHKLDALTRILEVEPFDAMIVFVRTRNATVELAERLCARGFNAEAIHGDIPQRNRERIIGNLRNGSLDILVATDVAARGLDVERISHVVNFDIPYDTEAYVHRIGRTGRAGRSGEAILFAAPRERHMLRTIERATGRAIEPMELPSHEAINTVRVQRFFDGLTQTLAGEDLTDLIALLERYQLEHGAEPLHIAAALAHQAKGGSPLLVKTRRSNAATEASRPAAIERGSSGRRERAARPERRAGGSFEQSAPTGERPPRPPRAADADMTLYRIAVGRVHGAEPRNIVGAIVNEAGLESRHVGRVELHDDYSLVQLPIGMPKAVFEHLKKVWVSGQQLQISHFDPSQPAKPSKPIKRAKPAKTASTASPARITGDRIRRERFMDEAPKRERTFTDSGGRAITVRDKPAGSGAAGKAGTDSRRGNRVSAPASRRARAGARSRPGPRDRK